MEKPTGKYTPPTKVTIKHPTKTNKTKGKTNQETRQTNMLVTIIMIIYRIQIGIRMRLSHQQCQNNSEVPNSKASTQVPEPEKLTREGKDRTRGPGNEDETETKTMEEDEETEDETQNEDEEIWQEYLKLASLPEPPSRIPPQHVKEFISAAERTANNFMKKKTTKALFDVVRLVKTVFFDPYTTRKKTGIIRQALKDYPRVDLPNPNAKGRRRKRKTTKTKTPSEEQKETIQRAERLFSDGYIRKAMSEGSNNNNKTSGNDRRCS